MKVKGITLLETLVYLGIFGVFFTVMIEFSISIAESNHKAELREQIQRTETFVIEHLENSFNNANSIDVANSIFNNDLGKIRLNNTGYFEYYVNNGVLKFNNTGNLYDLSNTKVRILKFYLEQAMVKTEPVGVRMTLEVGSSDGQESEQIESLFIIR